ncbi:MAG: hypothetical protein A2020_13010 [Lentisphaerae bacterium GWF2_45_14]|nr:MAG: hypothetical protein A2020_13010 [Lentisphaerae bacterium GWF2_45_14]
MSGLKRKFMTALALIALAFVTAESAEVYKENFNNYSNASKNGLRKAVEVKGVPGLKYALRLETIMDKKEKPIYLSWNSSFFDIGVADEVTVDYFMKPETDSTRYALFVKDKKGNQLVAPIIREGFIECCSLGRWAKAAPLKYDTWHHIRYAIHLLSETYDLYVDDMEKPKASGIKYRIPECGVPASLWSEGAETTASVSYFAQITVNAEKAPIFPPATLATQPHYIGGAVKTAEAPVIDGKGGDECWKNAQTFYIDKEGSEIKEKSSAKLLWDDKNLYILFQADAADMEKRANGETAHDGRVWMDDCFEIFIDPGLSGKDYVHFAGNSVGGLYDAAHKDGLRENSWESGWSAIVNKDSNSWSAELVIPFSTLGLVPKAGDIWGFNACRENPASSEVSAWRPLESFHNPEMFGKILFVDSKYQELPRETQIRMLGEKLYRAEDVLKKASANVKTVQDGENAEYFNKPCDALKSEISKFEKCLGTSQNFTAFYKNAMKANELYDSTVKLCADAERLSRFFAKDSENAKRGYVVSLESSMDKIPFENYSGSSESMPELSLAGREYGSFQMAVLPKPGSKLDSVSIKVSELKDKDGKVLSGSKIDSFMVKYVKTAKSSSFQQIIPDALWPGKEFKFNTPLDMAPFWFDVFVPADAPAGDYSATISITPGNCEASEIPVTVKVLPFSLPLKTSLPTAFCFVDHWVEGYYGAKTPESKRRDYFQFILDHRLEPMNLWVGGKNKLDMSEEDLEWTEKRGKSMLFLQVTRGTKDCEQYYKNMIKKYEGKLKPVFFGYDEILMSTPEKIAAMKAAYKETKETFPDVPRLNTSQIDEKLFNYVDIWCPLFNHFDKAAAESRIALGEQVWWYPTDYPLSPYANFNIDSDGIDPRVISWMTWKLDISGLLYWALNREWLSNYQEAERLTDKEKYARGLEWMTPGVQEKVKKGLRWPDVPWIPYFRSVSNPSAAPSATNGGGNLMYPGPDWLPIASTRLKNLRDGLQDYEYFVILKKNLELLKKQGTDNKELINKAEKALGLDKVTGGATSYTKDAKTLNAAKAEIAELIIEIQNELKKQRD